MLMAVFVYCRPLHCMQVREYVAARIEAADKELTRVAVQKVREGRDNRQVPGVLLIGVFSTTFTTSDLHGQLSRSPF
jgi:hypothetical protein